MVAGSKRLEVENVPGIADACFSSGTGGSLLVALARKIFVIDPSLT
jgi:hypothetical protein